MLIRRPNAVKQPHSRAFVSTVMKQCLLCPSAARCQPTTHLLQPPSSGRRDDERPRSTSCGPRHTFISTPAPPLPPPLADLIYWNEWLWLHIKSRSTACSFYYCLIFSSKPDRYSPPLTRFIYLIWDYWFIWRFAYKIKEKQYCMQLYYCLLFSSKPNRYSPLLTRLFQVVLYDSYIWFETYWFIFRLWHPNILIFL